MIFLGDIAVPECCNPLIDNLDIFRNKISIANLEGLITDKSWINYTKLYSNDNVIEFLRELSVNAVSMANNHVTDVPCAYERTKILLNDNNIQYAGAGLDIKEAQKVIRLTEDGNEYILLAFGWDVVGCKYISQPSANLGVNPLTEENVMFCVKQIQNEYPNARIIILPHWDYELEKYPMPMHREMARRLIDGGVYAVIGHHPHCLQQFEWYKGKLIFYSLGNWFIPHNIYMSGNLRFPDYTYDEVALEMMEDCIYLHRFKYFSENQELVFQGTDMFMKNMPDPSNPYTGIDDKEYKKWFRKNRVKKKALPIFAGSDIRFSNRLRSNYVKKRQKLVTMLRPDGKRK